MERIIGKLIRRKGDIASGLELEVVSVVDMLKLPKAMDNRRHGTQLRSSGDWEDRR